MQFFCKFLKGENMGYSQKEWNSIFGDNLKDILKETGYSQTDISSSTNISRMAINNYVKKRRTPKITSIIELSAEFEIPVHELIFFGDKVD